MKGSTKIVLLLSSLLFISEATQAQQYRGPQDYSGALQVPLPFPDRYPPIRPDMPSKIQGDILFLDSIVRSTTIPHGAADSMLATLTDVRLLKNALRRLYEIDDFDPIAYLQLLCCAPRGKSDSTNAYHLTSPGYIIHSLLDKADDFLADSGVSAALAKTDLIFQVTVLDTSTFEHRYSGSYLGRWGIVTCRIDEIFKGHRIPSCLTGTAEDSFPRVAQSAIGGCLQFEYSTRWGEERTSTHHKVRQWQMRNQIDGGAIASGEGPPPPWIFPGEKFILFASLTPNGTWRGHEWASVMPKLSCSTQMGLYQIQDGKVIDPDNDFAFGTGLSVEDFKAKLKSKIQSILN